MPPRKSKKVKLEAKDLVLAKMSGWSAWPSFVMPKNLIPPSVLKAKKKTTEYCVIFIPDGDFYWMTEKSLDPLSNELLAKKLEKIPNKPKQKKGRTLNVNDALLAAKGLTFDDFMKSLDLVNDADDVEDIEELESEVGDDEEVDVEVEKDIKEENEENEEEEEEEEEDEEEEEGPVDELDEEEEEQEGEEEVGLSKEESEMEEDINGNRTERKTSNKRKGTSAINGSKKVAKTENGKVEKKLNGANTENSSKESNITKVQTEEEKQHQLWLCRIKLQRSLIQRNQPVTPRDPKQYPPPTADELSVSRLILHRLVDFPVSVELLKQTKIHKVLKCILRDEELEFPDSFKLHEKCEELLSKWQPLIETIKLEKSVKVKTSQNGEEDKSKDEARLSSNPPDESEVSAIESNSNGKSNGKTNNTNDDNNNSSASSNINIDQNSEIPSTASVKS